LSINGAGAIAWQESITSDFNDANVQPPTEGATRNNIIQGPKKKFLDLTSKQRHPWTGGVRRRSELVFRSEESLL
jgi:hypothetical protein